MVCLPQVEDRVAGFDGGRVELGDHLDHADGPVGTGRHRGFAIVGVGGEAGHQIVGGSSHSRVGGVTVDHDERGDGAGVEVVVEHRPGVPGR